MSIYLIGVLLAFIFLSILVFLNKPYSVSITDCFMFLTSILLSWVAVIAFCLLFVILVIEEGNNIIIYKRRK
ncbi:MAG: hypothetical protein Unbinned200contig1002_35 [Prokaryotic dsDNA virus sp.]|jgi:hypothetical protein|nr:MAG: hypothetical protein Unbinned200contig1002_35 [Prokaryotic dsDNA virus sp.]